MSDTARTPKNHETSEPVPFDERTRRVMELRKQVREGTYRPDAGEVARAMLGEWIASGEFTAEEVPHPPVESADDRRLVATRFVVAPSKPMKESDSSQIA